MKDVLAAPVNKNGKCRSTKPTFPYWFMIIHIYRKKNYLHFGQKCVDVGGGRVKDIRRKVVPHFQTSKDNFFKLNKNLYFFF